MKNKYLFGLILIFVVASCILRCGCKSNTEEIIYGENCSDSLGAFNGVTAYYNKGFNSCVPERHKDADGYSYGFRWQCVEYVRRYYKNYLNHKMIKYGNAADYFQDNVSHGKLNSTRNLYQYKNGKTEKPRVNDILIFKEMAAGFGHVCIVIEVDEDHLRVIQQNYGNTCWGKFELEKSGDTWTIGSNCTGFLRKQ